MAGPTITFGGVASGLDVNAIISALLAVRARPIDHFSNLKAEIQTARSAMSVLRGYVEDLEAAAAKFKSASSFQAFTAESSDESVLSVSADGSAQASSYQVRVTSLARTEINVASGFADTDTTTVGTGTIKITVNGEEKTITLDSSNNSLAGIVQEINNADAGVSASIVNDGGANPYNLVITADASGTENAITFDYTGYTAGDVDLQTALVEQQAADDAVAVVNGITVTRSSNQIDDVIQGVTLNLLGQTQGSDEVTVTVSPNVEGITEDLQEFVDAYNAVLGYISSQFKYSQETGTGGALFGDITLATLRSRIQATVTGSVEAGGLFDSLGSIGITTQRDGTLSLNATDLEEALEDDTEGVVSLFVEGEGGIASSLESLLEEYTKFDGILSARDDGFADRIDHLNDQIDRGERRLDAYEERLRMRFAALEALLGGLQSQMAFLQNSFKN